MKYLPPCALGNCVLRSRRLPRPFAFPRIENRRGGALVSRPHGAAQRADQRPEREHPTNVFPVVTRLAASRPVSTAWSQSLHERAAPWFGAATCPFCPSSSESDGV